MPWPLDGEVHLYGLTLPHAPLELARLGSFLAPGETERAGLLKSATAKTRYIAGRGVLREILGSYLRIAARQVQLTLGEQGKPFLAAALDKLCFNLAHSGDYFLLAVAANREVGVDIETIAPDKPLAEMARIVFSRHEQDQLSRLSSPHLETAFYRCWVRKEACLKACGRGFSLPSNSFELSPPDEATAGMTTRCDQKFWQVVDLDAPLRCCAALALESAGSAPPPPKLVWIDHPLSFGETGFRDI